MTIYNNNYTSTHRELIYRTDTPGLVPILPSGVTDVNDHSYGDWADNMIYDSELFLNTYDDKLYIRSDNDILLLGYSGMTGTFDNLSDTPATKSSFSGYFLSINSGETAIEYVPAPIDTNDILSQSDVFESTYSGFSGYSMTINSGMTGFEFTQINNNFDGLSDTPTTKIANQFIRSNSSATELEYIDLDTLYDTLATNTTLTGEKTFDAAVVVNSGITINSLSMTNTITNISTDSVFTSSDNNTLVSQLAIKTYIDNSIFGSGVTNYTSDNIDETITGEWIFNSQVVINDTLTTDLLVTDNTITSSTGYYYLGDSTTNGSWRWSINGDGNMEFEKRVTGSWITKQIIT